MSWREIRKEEKYHLKKDCNYKQCCISIFPPFSFSHSSSPLLFFLSLFDLYITERRKRHLIIRPPWFILGRGAAEPAVASYCGPTSRGARPAFSLSLSNQVIERHVLRARDSLFSFPFFLRLLFYLSLSFKIGFLRAQACGSVANHLPGLAHLANRV